MVINSEKWSDIYHQFEGRQTTPLENNFFVTEKNKSAKSTLIFFQDQYHREKKTTEQWNHPRTFPVYYR